MPVKAVLIATGTWVFNVAHRRIDVARPEEGPRSAACPHSRCGAEHQGSLVRVDRPGGLPSTSGFATVVSPPRGGRLRRATSRFHRAQRPRDSRSSKWKLPLQPVRPVTGGSLTRPRTDFERITTCGTTWKCIPRSSSRMALGSLKTAGLKRERSVPGVPARWAETGPEIDQRVARELLQAERLGDREDLLATRQRAMRLLVTQGPERRHLGTTGESSIPQPSRSTGSRAVTTKRSMGQGRCRAGRSEATLLPVRSNDRPADERTAPSRWADRPGHRYATAVGEEATSPLPAPHPIDRASAIKLGTALAKAQDRPVAQVEGEGAVLPINANLLDETSVRRLDANRERLGRNRQMPVPCAVIDWAGPGSVRRKSGWPQSCRPATRRRNRLGAGAFEGPRRSARCGDGSA